MKVTDMLNKKNVIVVIDGDISIFFLNYCYLFFHYDFLCKRNTTTYYLEVELTKNAWTIYCYTLFTIHGYSK